MYLPVVPGVVDVVGVDVGVDVLADRPVVPVLVLPLHRVPVLGKKAKLKYLAIKYANSNY